MARYGLFALFAVTLFAVACSSQEQFIPPTSDTATSSSVTPTSDPADPATVTPTITDATPEFSVTATVSDISSPTPLPTRPATPRFTPDPTQSPTPAPTATSTPGPTAEPTEFVPPTPVPQVAGRNVPIDPFPGDLDWLRVEGNKLVNESGETVILRGANVEGWTWIWEDSTDLNRLLAFERAAIPVLTTQWGANVVHIDAAAHPLIEGDPLYIQALDEMIATAKANGAYTVISMRYESIDFEPEVPTQDIEDGLAILAGRYSNEPAVLYVLGSEPRNMPWAELKPRLTSMIDAVRVNHPQPLVFVPGTEWSRYVFQHFEDPIERENIAFQVNTFDTWELVQFGNGGYFQPLRLDEIAAEYPVLIGGFGVFKDQPADSTWMNTTEDLQAFINMIEANDISWTAWLFQDSGCPCLLEKPWQAFEPTEWGAIIRDLMQEHADN